MIALEIAGLVEVRSASGVYVLGRPSPAPLSSVGYVLSEMGPFDIFAARLAVEGEGAPAAAENATTEDIADMADAIEEMRLVAQSGRSTKLANQRFHMALGVAAKNPMLLKIIRLIWAEVPKRGPIWAKLDARRHMRSTRIAEHELILRAITERNPDHARAATRAHLASRHQGLPGARGGRSSRIRSSGDSGKALLGNDIATGLSPQVEGFIAIPDAPGIGLSLVDDVERQFPKKPRPIRMRAHADGSVVDT